MRLISKTDTPLAAGLVIGAVILFHQPLRWLLDAARNVEGDYHLDLVPALVVLATMFAFHQHRKRKQSQADAMTSAAEARQHLERTRELEALVGFGRLLSSALDVQGLRHAVSSSLANFIGDRGMWVVVRRQGGWHMLAIDPVTEQDLTQDDLERAATTALFAGSGSEAARAEGAVVESSICFPLVVGVEVVGVLGIREGKAALDGSTRRAIGVAASLLGIAIRNVNLIIDTRDVSVHDPLTGCLNRKPGLEALDAEMRRAKRSNMPLSVLMLDIDQFKQINDRFGHQCGDQVLAAVGRRLVHTLRGSDIKCRYGGDEFILILPETPLQGAQQVANGLRKEIMAQAIEFNGHPLSVTVSIGIADAVAGETDVKALIARADQALYDAKKAGRNRSSAGSPGSIEGGSDPSIAVNRRYVANDLGISH